MKLFMSLSPIAGSQGRACSDFHCRRTAAIVFSLNETDQVAVHKPTGLLVELEVNHPVRTGQNVLFHSDSPEILLADREYIL